MDLASYRRSRDLTQEQAAAELNLSSKGYFSRIENGFAPIGLRLALQIEAWSGGVLRAIDLLPPEDAQLLRDTLDRNATSEAA